MIPINSVTIGVEKYDNLKDIQAKYIAVKDLQVEANKDVCEALLKFILSLHNAGVEDNVLHDSMTNNGFRIEFNSGTHLSYCGTGKKILKINDIIK